MTYVLSILSSVIGIGLNFYLARVLQAELYGEVQYLVALATTISQICIFGLNTFLIKEAANKERLGDVFSKCFSLYLTIFLFVFPLIYFVLFNYSTQTEGNRFLTGLVLGMAFLMGINALVVAKWQGTGKYHLSIILETLIPKLGLLILAVVFVALTRIDILSDYYLLLYILVYSTIAIPSSCKMLKGLHLSFSGKELSSIFFFFGTTITYSLGNELTKVLQGGMYQNEVALGIISVSISMINLVAVFTGALNNMSKPIFAKCGRENNIAGLTSIYQFNVRFNAYIAIPFYAFFVIFPSRFLSLFGETYLAYPGILSILALANAIATLTGPNGTMLAMAGKEKWELFNGILYFSVYLLSVFCFSFDRVYGLSFSLLFAQLVVNGAKYIESWALFKVNPINMKTAITVLLTLLINSLAVLPLLWIQNIYAWFGVGVATGVALVFLNVFLLSLYRKTDFKDFLAMRL